MGQYFISKLLFVVVVGTWEAHDHMTSLSVK